MELFRHILFSKAGIGANLVHDYLEGKDQVAPFYQFQPNEKGLTDSLEQRKKIDINRQLLYDVLHRQYGKGTPTKEVKQNIEWLLQPNTFTVTTGHQLNLFTGPLYFIYKIASVISLSRKLQDEHPGHNFVPVYWMNSEDHDFEEINHFYWANRKWEWNEVEKPYGPVGRMKLDTMSSLLSDLKAEVASLNKTDGLFQYMLEVYSNASDLSLAHREIVDKLFGKYGVLVLDQDDPDLKKSFSKFIKEEIIQPDSSLHIEETNQQLLLGNYQPQVFVREINFFYTGLGTRERIIETDGQFHTNDGSKQWSKKEMIAEIESSPANFSPNVVTRPLYQEFVLPNVAYIGGPSEVAYWLQYKSNFQKKGIFFPAILMRDCFLYLSDKTVNKLRKLNVSVEQFFQSRDELITAYIKQNYSEEISMEDFFQKHNELYQQLSDRMKMVDPSLDTMVGAARQKGLNELERIGSKIQKAVKRKNESEVNALTSIHDEIFPSGVFQERIKNILDINLPAEVFIDQIIALSNCLDTRLKLVY